MQPWTTAQQTSNNWQVPAGLVNYQIPGGAPANVAYSGGNPSLFDFNKDAATTTNGTTTTQDQLWWQQPGWDYSGRYGGTAGQPFRVQSWPSALDWTRGQLTPAQQATGWKNLAAGKAADPLGLANQVADTGVNPGGILDY